ncbi:phytanoyl-CoA dioxygenase family protein [Caballeronia sp. LZ065]|uniref:phytanoyl-CoA dioxygenase family protein n=1 Tax=Caballeronia sp. LZ065 TaxID=3038571 RepID=UPI002857C9E3|nr:phytanoyl-CoA dioxygenase family protein [Caballeronia sp. LZ065]MDR5782198.1 phytanoyl-CoA dioxygenase family protein [Caballeronia sp. LZ065]
MTTLSQSQCGNFWKDGFLRLENVATHAELKTLRSVGDRLLREKAGFNEGLLFDFYPEGEGPEKPKLAQLHHPSHFERSLLEMDLARRAQRVAMQLLGPKARFVSDSFFHKPSHTEAVTPWHQDEAFTDPRIEHREVNFWFPLQPVSLENGCMQFIPGSHLGPVLPHGPIGGDPTTHGLECTAGFESKEAVICPLQLGDCTIHGGRTLHFAGPNPSDAPRYAYSMVFGLPRRASSEVRTFPWNDNRKLSRDQRVHESRRAQGSFWPYLYRKVKEFDYTNPYEWRLGAHRVARLIKKGRTPAK